MWCWIVDEIEAAGMKPRLVNAHTMMMTSSKKTDKLHVHSTNGQQQLGTEPAVWILHGALQDLRELFRSLMTFTRQGTGIKNPVRRSFAKQGNGIQNTRDIFNNRKHAAITATMDTLPEHTHFATDVLLTEPYEVEVMTEGV